MGGVGGGRPAGRSIGGLCFEQGLLNSNFMRNNIDGGLQNNYNRGPYRIRLAHMLTFPINTPSLDRHRPSSPPPLLLLTIS